MNVKLCRKPAIGHMICIIVICIDNSVICEFETSFEVLTS